MDPRRMKATYARLESLDERLTHKVRQSRSSLIRPSADQLTDRVRDLSEFTIELKEIVQDLIVAIAAKPSEPRDGG